MMPNRTLPQHPDLDQLKRQAKELLRSARTGDAAGLRRFQVLPGFARSTEEDLRRATLSLHDAQSVIAREHGFASWNLLSEQVTALTLGFDEALREFVEAATDGRVDRAGRLLKLHPRIARASFHAALVLGDAKLVGKWLTQDASRALKPDGPRGWEPLLYVCHSSLARTTATSADGSVAIARQLLTLGADPNMRFPWLHHGVRRPVLWGAVHVAHLLPLAELLLQAGADPNDGVTLPLAAAGDIAALDLLLSFGADPNQPWATDGAAALYAVLHWATTPTGIYWLLEHGAHPDPVFTPNGETPLHVVAKRWDAQMADALVSRGADLNRRRADGRTPYAVAEINGNLAVADWLRSRGASAELHPVDRAVAACGRGDRKSAEALLAAQPNLRAEYATEHYAALYRAAESGDSRMLEDLLACGLDPNRGDEEIGKTALHCAAMAGRADGVRILLAHGASPACRDREFKGTPLVWAAEGARMHGDRSADYRRVGEILLAAGSPVDWQPGEEPGEAILEIIDGWRNLERAE